MLDWMEDDNAVHALNLDAALQDFNIVLKMYMSALNNKVYTLEDAPQGNLVETLRDVLG